MANTIVDWVFLPGQMTYEGIPFGSFKMQPTIQDMSKINKAILLFCCCMQVLCVKYWRENSEKVARNPRKFSPAQVKKNGNL